MTDLFSCVAPAPAPSGKVIGRIPLRWCQREDVDAMMHAIETGHKKPACVAATGYGKGAMIAELVGRLRKNGKVVCLVDRAHLVHQLADEIDYHLGITCGRVADSTIAGLSRSVVVSTVQAMYTPDKSEKPLYQYSHFENTVAVVADEAHKFFADCAQSVLRYFVAEHGAVVPLFTATPVAANGARWQSFVDWTPGAEGPCMRTTGWCVRNGYLVPPKQAFVRVNLKIADIYKRLSDDDETDNEDRGDELSELLLSLLHDKSEKSAAKFAAGIVDVIGARRALIFSPRRIAAAKLLASWISATGRMECHPIWGARVDKDSVLEKFEIGCPQALANVDLLCEGYNNPCISAVFICRLLKSWRLINQMVGRALRPHPGIVDALNGLDNPDQAQDRSSLIAQSEKPDALVADLVGLDDEIVQASAVDILYADEGEEVRTELGKIFKRRQESPTKERVDAELLAQAREIVRQKQNERLAEMARRRGMAGGIEADVSVEYGSRTADLPTVPTPKASATLGEKAMFVAVAVQYDLDRAISIAERTPRHQLRGMTFGMKSKLEKDGKRPDWPRARRAFPEWAKEIAARKGAK